MTDGPWKKDTRDWDGEEYGVIVGGDGAIVCMAPVEFFAYPEGAFIKVSGDPADLDAIEMLPDIVQVLRDARPWVVDHVAMTSDDFRHGESGCGDQMVLDRIDELLGKLDRRAADESEATGG